MKKSLTRLYFPLKVLGAFLALRIGRSMMVLERGGTVLRLNCACCVGRGACLTYCCRLVNEFDLGGPEAGCFPKGSIMLVMMCGDC